MIAKYHFVLFQTIPPININFKIPQSVVIKLYNMNYLWEICAGAKSIWSFADFKFLDPPWMRICIFMCPLCLCPYIWWCAFITPERYRGFYSYSEVRGYIIIVRCPTNLSILPSKYRGTWNWARNTKWRFSRKPRFIDFNKFQ